MERYCSSGAQLMPRSSALLSWMSNVKEPLPSLFSVSVLLFVQEDKLRIVDCSSDPSSEYFILKGRYAPHSQHIKATCQAGPCSGHFSSPHFFSTVIPKFKRCLYQVQLEGKQPTCQVFMLYSTSWPTILTFRLTNGWKDLPIIAS